MVAMSNDEFVDNLVIRGLITKLDLEKVFRLVSRTHFYPGSRGRANGNQHVTPEADVVAIDALNLKPGMNFLHFECDSGYVNAIAGFLLGPWGKNVGLGAFETHVNRHSVPRLTEFLDQRILKSGNYCVPTMFLARGIFIKGTLYDCVYCNRDIPDDRISEFIHLVRIGGTVVLCNQNKLKIFTRQRDGWSVRDLRAVSAQPLNTDLLPDFTIVLPNKSMRTLLHLSAMQLKVDAFERACEQAILQGIRRPLLLSYIKDNTDGLQTFIASLRIDMSDYDLPPRRRSIITDILNAGIAGRPDAEWLTHLGRVDQIPGLNITGLDHEQELMEKKTYLLRGIYLYKEAAKKKPRSHEIDRMMPLFHEYMEHSTLPPILNSFIVQVSRNEGP